MPALDPYLWRMAWALIDARHTCCALAGLWGCVGLGMAALDVRPALFVLLPCAAVAAHLALRAQWRLDALFAGAVERALLRVPEHVRGEPRHCFAPSFCSPTKEAHS